MVFEEFESGRPLAPARHVPTVKVISNGSVLSLNAAAMRLLEEDVHRVRFLFDPDERLLAFEPAAEDDPRSYRLNRMPSQGSVSVKALVRRYGISVGVAWPLRREGRMFVAAVGDASRQ